MVDLRIDSEVPEGSDAADSQKKFLLQTVLPIASVEVIGDLTILRRVRLIVSVKQIEVGTTHGHLPETGGDRAPREGHACGHPVALGVHHRLGRDLREVLGVVTGYLLALTGDDLGEVAVTVQKSDSHEVDVHVAGLLEVVTGQKPETAGVDLKRGVKAIFHAEICDGRILALRLESHVGVELVHDGLQLAEEGVVLGQGLEPLEAHSVKQSHGIVAGVVPDDRIDRFEQGFRGLVPAPPKVFGKCLETGERIRKVTGHHHALPGRVIDYYLLVHH